MGYGEAGGFLLRLLFGGAFGLGDGVIVDEDFYAEKTFMVGTGFFEQTVGGFRAVVGLEHLLEGGFVVADGGGELLAGGEGAGSGVGENFALDEGSGGFQAGVEVEGRYEGFDDVGEEGGVGAGVIVLRGVAEKEVGAELEAGADLAEMPAADYGGAEAGERTFAMRGEASVEGLGSEEAEDGVADELELLVILGGIFRICGGSEAGVEDVGAVGEGKGEEGGVDEGVAQDALEGGGWGRYASM